MVPCGKAVLPVLSLLALGAAPVPRPPAVFPGARAVLFVGAHPDDEVLLAPLLARVCVDQKLACSFLVLTRGEAGRCLLPDGCRPDLGAVRTAEMARAARLYGARLTLWRLQDGAGQADGSAPGWDQASGGHSALVARVASFVKRSGADLVLGFDPRHGSTGHADHRAAGHLLAEALATLPAPPAHVLLETRVEIREPFALRFSPGAIARDGAFAFDANVPLLATGRPAWEAILANVAVHKSQFDAPWLAALGKTPIGQRAVYLAPAWLVDGPAGSMR